MDALKAIYTRRAVRSYKDIAVTSEVLAPLLHAAVQAPSAVNQQPWEFAIFQGKHKLAEYSDEAKAVFPMVIGYPDGITEAPPRNDPLIVALEVSQLDQVHAGG